MVSAFFACFIPFYKRQNIAILITILCIPIVIFGQDAERIPENLDNVSIGTESLSEVPEFLTKLDTPKIIKNNVRVNNLIITKTEIDTKNQLIVEGTVEITNYAETATSGLYMTSYLGIKGTSYYVQYPFYKDERSEAFFLEPQKSITRQFRIVEDNFLAFGAAGVEVVVFDEYNKRVHAEASRIPEDSFPPIATPGTIFTDLSVFFILGDKKFMPAQGPTFYPETEDMFLNFDFTKSLSPLKNIEVKVYDGNFFTQPITELTAEIPGGQQKPFSLVLPENLKPGVYPIAINFISTDVTYFVPTVYGRFIVGGNMGKVLDASLQTQGGKTDGVTVVIQGNAPDMMSFERDTELTFDAKMYLYGKNDELLVEKKITGQNVQIYRNIDIALDTPVKVSKIYKAKVELIDKNGIFDTYEKLFSPINETIPWLLISFLVGCIIILIFLIRLWSQRHKKTIATVSVIVLICLVFFGIPKTEAQMTPAPGPGKSLGAFVYDANDLFPGGKPGQFIPSSWCTDVANYHLCLGDDMDILRNDNILAAWGITVDFSQPIFYNQDPSHCYAPGQIIPVVMNYKYGICTNSPLTCPIANCGTISAQPYANIRIATNPSNWYWNLQDWYIKNNVLHQRTRLNGHVWHEFQADDILDYDNRDQFPQFSMDNLASYIDSISAQNGDTINTAVAGDKQDDGIGQAEGLLAWPITSGWRDVDITPQLFNVDGNFEYSLITPEQPGIYSVMMAINFQTKQGKGYYVAEQQIRVCGQHDADYLMPGTQVVGSDGELTDSISGIAIPGYMIQQYPADEGIINASANYDLRDGDGNIVYDTTSPIRLDSWGNQVREVIREDSFGNEMHVDFQYDEEGRQKFSRFLYDNAFNLVDENGDSVCTQVDPLCDVNVEYWCEETCNPVYDTNSAPLYDTDSAILYDMGSPVVHEIILQTKQIDGFNQSPYSEFNFVTTANYCGSKEVGTQRPTTGNYLGNNWVNFYTNNLSSLSTKPFWGNLLSFVREMPGVWTKIPVFASKEFSGSYETRGSYNSQPFATLSNTYKNYSYIIHKEGNDYKFINLNNPLLPKYNGGNMMSGVLKLEDLDTIPKEDFATMLASGKFNTDVTDPSSPLILVKDNRTIDGVLYTCSLYEDFCSVRPGIQYIIEVGNQIELWDRDTNLKISSTHYFNPIAMVDALCGGTACQGTVPSNALLCTGDDTGLTTNVNRSLVNSCSATKCEYTCNSATHYYNAGVCTPYACQGTAPSNALLCTGDDTGLTTNVNRSLVNSCGAEKCEYTCQAGTILDTNTWTCIVPKDGQCGTSIYSCLYPVSPTIPSPGYNANQFIWSCQGDIGKNTASCVFGCPLGFSPDPITLTCINDFCLNINGLQDMGYITSNDLFREGDGTCYEKLTVTCSGSPLLASIGQEVTWSPTISGGRGLPSNFTYYWFGDDTDYDYALYSWNSIAQYSYTTLGIKTAYLEVYDENWQQHVSTQCEVVIDNVVPYACQGTVPSNALLCTGDDTGLTTNVNRSLVNSCSATKCEYTCNSAGGYIFVGGVCTKPPATPTGLSAAQSTCGNNWLNLSWNASVGATNYKVYRGITKIYDGPLLAFSDTGLTLGGTYTYTIEASNAGGTSARSTPAVSGTVSSVCNYTLTINTAGTGGGTTIGTGTYTSGASVTATATPNALSTFTGWSGDCNSSGQVTMNSNKTCTATFTAIPPPATPTGLSAAPSTCGNNWLNLSWNASVGATNYKVYRGITKVYDGPLLAFSDTGLTLGSAYTYTIEASNAGGTSTRLAPAISGTVNIACPDLTASITSPTTATLNTPLNFTATITSANAATGVGFNTLFQVATQPNGGGTISVISVNSRAALATNTSGSVTSSSYTFTATGEYSVRACTDNNASFIGVITESNELNNCSLTWTTVKVPPATPTGLSAAQSTCGNNWLNLSWNASVGATNYKVYRGITKIYDGPLLAFSDTGLTLGGTYTYTIEASNAGGTSARSTPAVSGTVSSVCNYTLTINTAGTGGGTTIGTGTYTSGASVTATATPNALSTFTGWSGDCNSSGQVTMNSNKTCTATFTAIPPPATPTGLSAAPSTCGNNWLNLSWNASVGATNYKVYRGITKVYDGPLLAFSDTGLTLGSAYTYTIEATNAGGTSALSTPAVSGTVSLACPIPPDLTATVTAPITAIIDVPQAFTATVTSSSAGTGVAFNTLFQVADQANGGGTISVISVNATAALTTGASRVVTSSSYPFPQAKTYSVRACTDNNAAFVGVVAESNEFNNCSPTWTNVEVSAQYPLIYHANGGTGTPPSYGYNFLSGAKATILGPNTLSRNGYNFSGWKTNPNGASSDYTPWGVGDAFNAYNQVTVTQNMILYAHWVQITYDLSTSVMGSGSITGNTSPYIPGNLATITAVPTVGNTFTNWSGDCVGTNPVCSLTMNAHKSATAHFSGPAVGSFDSCFADNTTGKNLTNYLGNLIVGSGGQYGLLRRVKDNNLGYILTDTARAEQTKTFRTKLSGNITKYITSRYCPKIITSSNWDADYTNDSAIIDPILWACDSTYAMSPNKNGYFYYKSNAPSGVLTVSGVDNSISQPTVLYVVGADIYIQENIVYAADSGESASLVIIAQKDGNNGGNIYIDPSVTHIDGTLIADGALMNGIGNVAKNWIADEDELPNNRLFINGRLLTYNTRGGSLKMVAGNSLTKQDFDPTGSPVGYCVHGMKIEPCDDVDSDDSWDTAASQDLEKFRMITPDVTNTTCSLYVTNNIPIRRPDILTTILD